MAEHDGLFPKGGHVGGRNRDDDNFDRRPGNEWESRGYSKHFDPRSEQEYTSGFLEQPDQIRDAELRKRQAEVAKEAHNAKIAAQSDVHFFPNVGKFIIPEENTWAAHAELVKDDRTGLSFNPDKYLYFDRIIAKRLGVPDLYDYTKPNYAKYEGLRTNLEVLRNDIIGQYVNDGTYDPEDAKYIPRIESIANAIADGLANDTTIARPFTRSIDKDVANIEGVGAAEIYKHLLEMQHSKGMFSNLRANLQNLTGLPDRTWELKPLEATPFSQAGLSAPPPKPKITLTEDELNARIAQAQQAMPQTHSERMVALSEITHKAVNNIRSVESMQEPARAESVEEARKILRWLKNLEFTDKDLEEFLSTGDSPGQIAKAEALQGLVQIYSSQLNDAIRKNPNVANRSEVEDASGASGAIALALAERAITLLPPGHPDIDRLEVMISTLPKQAELRQTQSVQRILETLELGLEQLTQAPVTDKSSGDRLVEMSNRIQAHARKLRSVDTLEPPAREESIELAREILRRLKNMKFSDRDMQDMVDTGRPDEKVLLAAKIDEMVDAYKNLLFEAAQDNPDIMKDPRVQEANEAVGQFAHSVKLMAAKEMPNSLAAAQQISADVTQMPEDWKDLHNRTVNRLMKSMEGGLEKAVDSIEQAQQDQQQDQELAQEAIEASLASTDQSKRKKKRKKRHSSGKGGKKQNKQQLDLTADDYILKQGRFSEESKGIVAKHDRPRDPNAKGDHLVDTKDPTNPAIKGVDAKDLDAIRKLGNSLRGIGETVKGLPVTNVASTDKIAPDDKTLTQRTIENELNKKNGPRGIV